MSQSAARSQLQLRQQRERVSERLRLFCVTALLAAAFFALCATATVRAETTPAHSLDEVEAYLHDNEEAIRDKLEAYNKANIGLKTHDDKWFLGGVSWKIHALEGDRVFLVISYEVGRAYWRAVRGRALFELRWTDNELAFVGHKDAPQEVRKASGWLGDSGRRCTPNYYAPNPCIDTVGRWTEFAEINQLPLDPESAAIFQAYMQNDDATGDRMLAKARGQPDPTGESVFTVQRQVAALNLGQLQANSETPCDLSPYGPRPCPGLLQRLQSFARQHGLAVNQNTAAMFEAYAYGNFVKADVLYALAKGLDAPTYGYVPTDIARDSALIALQRTGENGEVGGCVNNPYAAKPCAGSVEAWRDFAARYQLEDSAAGARIFQAYAEGEPRVGDRLFAQAKGVPLDVLLEAAGVPSKGLVIEVYPGSRQKLERVLGS